MPRSLNRPEIVGAMNKLTTYSPEVREWAVRMVFEHAPECPSQWMTVQSITEKIGCSNETLRNWVRQGKRGQGKRAGLTTDERARLKKRGAKIESRSARTRSSGRNRRTSHRRNSTADHAAGGHHLTTSGVQCRADLRRAADPSDERWVHYLLRPLVRGQEFAPSLVLKADALIAFNIGPSP
jgi:transposase-like protein